MLVALIKNYYHVYYFFINLVHITFGYIKVLYFKIVIISIFSLITFVFIEGISNDSRGHIYCL